MVNAVEASPILLEGRGFCHRPVGNYLPGEFKRLSNVEITDEGTLRTRMPVEIGSNAFFTSEAEFIGHLEDWTVIHPYEGDDKHYFVRREAGGQNTNTIWSGDDLYASAFDPTSDAHAVVGFFRYNGRNYWISISSDYTGTVRTHKFYLHNFAPGTAEDVTVLPLVFQHDIPTVHTFLFSVVVDDLGMFGVQPFEYRRFFWFRDRLWIITNRGVYFSKATDPTDFSAPEGGFFLFPDDLIKDAIAHHDRIYVMGSDDLSYITYSTDPNGDDAQVVSIARGVGGDAIVLHEDSVYMARVDQLYLVEASRVTKVLDLDLGIATGTDIQLTSFFDYLIFCARTLAYDYDVDGVAPTKEPSFSESGYYLAGDNPSGWWSSNFWINMKNSTVHEFDYRSNSEFYIEDDHTSWHVPVSWYLNPFETVEDREYYLWFLTGNNEPSFGGNRVMSMRISNRDRFATDAPYDFDWRGVAFDTASKSRIPQLVEIDSFSPDGSEMWMKKFRTFVLEGEFPKDMDPVSASTPYNMKWDLAFGDQELSDDSTTYTNKNGDLYFPNGVNLETRRMPISVRLPINQRSRSLTFRIRQDLQRYADGFTEAVPLYHRFQLVRATVFWTPTNRASISRYGADV